MLARGPQNRSSRSPKERTTMASSDFSILDFDSGWAGVDVWESPGILSAAEADAAEKATVDLKKKIKIEKDNHDQYAASVRRHMEEMVDLLKKVELSTATKTEMQHLAKLEKELEHLKLGLTATKSAIKSYTEELVKSQSKMDSYAVMKTTKERGIKSVIRFVSEAETVDLAFLLDCTGSMSGHIEAAKSCMKDVVRQVKTTNKGLHLRVAVVCYRDIGDENHFQIQDFTSSIEEFERFVTSLDAQGGGGDATEDIAGAFQKANTLSWQQMSRITFLIADYPCHGSSYYAKEQCFDGWDDRPNGTPGICIESEMRELVNKGGQAGMQFHFGRITDKCDTMIRVFHEKGIAFDVCDVADPRKLSSLVSSSVRKSISKSVTASVLKSKSKTGGALDLLEEGEIITKQYTISEATLSPDEWKSVREIPIKVLCNKAITSINDLKAPLHFGLVRFGKSASAETSEAKMLMRRAINPFAEGEMRLAYYGKLGQDEAALTSDQADKILKSFKKTRKSSSDRKQYLCQMEVSSIAHFLAEGYNKTCRPSHCPEVHFLAVNVIEVEGLGGERFCAEDHLSGDASDFKKYSNNTGYWNEDELNQSLLLFTQFTFDKTEGYLMVTDLQGVRNGNQYILTDPAILCKDSTRFGGTNLGGKFIDKCLNATKAMLEEYGWDQE